MSNNKKVKSGCEESDRKARVEKVAAILKDLKYKTESDRLQAVLSFSRSSLSEAEIDMLCKPLRPDYLEGQIYKKGLY